MLRTHFVDAIYTQTEGQQTCIVYDGIPYPYGTDILEKQRFLSENYEWLIHALLREPRGSVGMYGAFVTPPSGPDSDAGVIWTEGEIFHDMCGHGTIALGMAMVALGLTPATEEVTTIRFESTSGPVTAEVSANENTVEWCRFENVPAFVAARDVGIELPEFGAVKADVVWGGNSYAPIRWDHPDIKICPENGKFFSDLGVVAQKILSEKVTLRHPTLAHVSHLDHVTFYHEPTNPAAMYRCVHVVHNGMLDRSPGGTGTSGMMAMLEARGELKIGQPMQAEGFLGTGTFEGCLIRETKLGEQRAVVPTIKGKANIIGYAKWLMDPNDPVGAGYVIS